MSRKTTVITGASSGIGAALAKILGAKDHNLVVAARREQELRQVAAQSGNHTVAVVCDVKKRGDMERLKTEALNEFGQVDIWVNNAGRGINKKVLDLSDDDFDEIIDVNLKSAWYGMQVIVPYFQQQKKGHLINISSFLARVPLVAFRSIYSASKAALNSLTANLRMDIRAEYPDIHISLVMPGAVTTDFAKNAIGGRPQTIPIGGIIKPQTADEVAQAIASLIDNPQAEIYTNPASPEIARQYYQDIAAFEERLRPRK